MRGLVLAASVLVARAAVDADLVTTLPGYGAPPSKWYSGYLQSSPGIHLHYIFIESTGNPTSDPVVAWFNGGPGCSSLEGLFAEQGQLLVDENDPSTLVLNPYAWTNASSMLFIEAPACVGYSYADDISGCTHNDSSQAIDNYAALQSFFTGFPEYAPNDFFITGESYAGIYVPTLAKQVVLGNAGGNPKINLKGIAVGNGCVGLTYGQCAFDWGVEINTNVPYFRGHGLISGVTYQAFLNDCPQDGSDPVNPSASCQLAINDAHDEVGNVNIYDIYGDCITGPSSPHKRVTKPKIDAATGLPVYTKAPVRRSLAGPVECIDETIAVYIGSAPVAAALHVYPNLNWAVCGSNSSFNYVRTEADERIDVYPTIVAGGVRVMIYNGEADACVPYIDNENWVHSMNYSTVKPWASWLDADGQVGGYSTHYANNFSFVTIKGAGHMAAQIKPSQMWTVMSTFFSGSVV